MFRVTRHRENFNGTPGKRHNIACPHQFVDCRLAAWRPCNVALRPLLQLSNTTCMIGVVVREKNQFQRASLCLQRGRDRLRRPGVYDRRVLPVVQHVDEVVAITQHCDVHAKSVTQT